ncbi:MAG: cation:proton antiporter [Oleiphilaceae bacterium]|nr:cation:proton antiporter family protein [Oleiphilus sp. HI0125]KZZ60625.1 potassium transporter Kef [Oleiphilus sp. HI0125]MCH2159072.1 cation:proton antiporter [Oleiphilaceae bacterium]
MSIALILAAYFSGLTAKVLGLPPLVGYLLAGFGLHFAGYTLTDDIQRLADLGITLMLFTIGLKINVKDLIQKEVWGSAISHMSLWIALCFVINAVMAWAGLLVFELSVEQTALLIFALSFSSTVCVIKVLEDSGEIRSRQSAIAVGVLIIQDIIAVAFLVAATGKVPSFWALLLLGLPLLTRFVDKLLNKTGHGELLPLSGLMLALGAYALFELVNVKGDLGALLVGMLVATSSKSGELYKSLISFKDLFLVSFFLSIGLSALPDFSMFILASLLLLLLPLKFLLFYAVFCVMSLRARTAFLGALLLSNFSEFGLIVAALSIREGLLAQEWLIILAITTAQSFVITSLIYKKAHLFYAKLSGRLQGFQRANANTSMCSQVAQGADVMLVGLGRVGLGAYHALVKAGGNVVWGVEIDESRVAGHINNGITNVIHGDADDIEFWESQDLDRVKLVMLAIPNVEEMINIIEQLKLRDYKGKISAVAQHDDERLLLLSHGVDVVFNYYSEVGAGFAEETSHLLQEA